MMLTIFQSIIGRHKQWLAWLGMGWFMYIPSVQADLVVIYDSGHARPITEFIKGTSASAQPTMPLLPNLQSALDSVGQDFLAQLFPVHTPELTPGMVPISEVKVTTTLPQTLFILGTDPLSQQWLVDHRDRLTQLGAVGLVVEVQSVTDYQALKALAGGLPLSPVPGSDLALLLALTHYPVLVIAEGNSLRLSQ